MRTAPGARRMPPPVGCVWWRQLHASGRQHTGTAASLAVQQEEAKHKICTGLTMAGDFLDL
jgi:hypothetical protein